jgi:hypothetical protein
MLACPWHAARRLNWAGGLGTALRYLQLGTSENAQEAV